MQFGWVNMRAYNFFVSGPKLKVHHLLFAQRGRVVVDQLRFRFSTGRCVWEIFAIKLESCLKSRRILAPKILVAGLPQKLCPFEHRCFAARHVEKFW